MEAPISAAPARGSSTAPRSWPACCTRTWASRPRSAPRQLPPCLFEAGRGLLAAPAEVGPAGRAEVVLSPAVDQAQAGIQLLAQDQVVGAAVPGGDLLGAEPAAARIEVVDPPDSAEVEDVSGPLPQAQDQGRLTAQLPREAQL